MRWFLGIAGILVVSLVLQAGLVAFAGYVLLGVFATSRYLARNWIESLSATVECNAEPCEIGSEVEVVVTVSNSGKLLIPWVLAEHFIPEITMRHRRLKLDGKHLRVLVLRAGGEQRIKYRVTFLRRGYYQFGPLFLETGDVFGLHRRHRVLTQPAFVLVYPKVLPLASFDFRSQRPIGEVRLANRLFEDPTRSAGVRPYQLGDPLQRVHWRATARTGQLHSKIYEPTTLAGATLLLDFHQDGYPSRGEPQRSDLAVTTAASLAYAVAALNQQIGFVSNGRDATDRIREEAVLKEQTAKLEAADYATRNQAREHFEEKPDAHRLKPVTVDTRRGYDQFGQIRETLARLELTDGLSFASLIFEVAPRLPKDATVIALLPTVSVETSVALGQLRRQGFAISVLLIGLGQDGNDARVVAHGRLAAEGIRDVRFLNTETDLLALGDRSAMAIPTEYAVSASLA
ncbi:DUF58 domain-containing protein [soil metagenome]